MINGLLAKSEENLITRIKRKWKCGILESEEQKKYFKEEYHNIVIYDR